MRRGKVSVRSAEMGAVEDWSALPELSKGPPAECNHALVGFYVYILPCSDGSYHTGHIDGLERRVAAHQRGEILGYIHGRRPIRLIFAEEFGGKRGMLSLASVR